MPDESDLVPFAPTALRGETVLALASHPDDEVIGCGGLLAQLAGDGRRVRVVIATDGGGWSDDAAAREAARRTRHDEALKALAILGIDDVHFLDLPDRRLREHRVALDEHLHAHFAALLPDLVLVPSPVEIHPDHRALSESLYAVLARRELALSVPGCRVAFFEVSHPIRPNTLVDITAEMQAKGAALSEHRSQTGIARYQEAMAGLNAYRALGLGRGVSAAEAYWVCTIDTLRGTSLEALRREISGAAVIREVHSPVSVTVVIRTKDRLPLLREAIASARANDFPARIVVVNDGRASLDELAADPAVRVIDHGGSRGRSAAMNSGVSAADTSHVAFLDDDDLFFPEHLATLCRAAEEGTPVGFYTDAVSIVYALGDDGRYVELRRERVYEQDFDADLLQLTNYVPLTTLLVRRDEYLSAGGFSEEVRLFEDWDFLLRLTRRGSLVRIPRLTAAIRHFPGSGSAVLASPESSAAFQNARQLVWQRNGVLTDPHAVGRAVDSLKRLAERPAALQRAAFEARKRLAMFVRTSRQLRMQLDEARLLVGSELALSPSRRRRVDAILTRTFELQRSRLESIARFDDDPGEAIDDRLLARSVTPDEEVRALRSELEATRRELHDIHRSTLWKVGSMYWRLLHALGILEVGRGSGAKDGRSGS